MASIEQAVFSSAVNSFFAGAVGAMAIGGMVTSTIHVLIITPVIFYMMKVRALRKGRLTLSGMTV